MFILYDSIEINNRDRLVFIAECLDEEELLEEIVYAVETDGVHPNTLLVYRFEDRNYFPVTARYEIEFSDDEPEVSNVIPFVRERR